MKEKEEEKQYKSEGERLLNKFFPNKEDQTTLIRMLKEGKLSIPKEVFDEE